MPKSLRALVGEFLSAYPEYKEAGNRTIARLMVEEYPGMLLDVERMRTVVRDVRGNKGERDRHLATDPRPNGEAGAYVRKMPASMTRVRTPFHLPPGKILVVGDMHVPYHDEAAVELAVDFAPDADMILLNGDFLDCHRLSRFTPEADAISFANERIIGIQMLEFLRDRFPNANFYYKVGNHEERLEQYLYQKAPDIADLACWRLDQLLGLEDLGIEYITDKRMITAGPLAIFHGHELLRGLTAPVNPARGAFLKANCHTLVGHHHKTSEHCETDAHGDMTTCWSVGCLCNLSPTYAPFAKSNHGFAVVEHDGSSFHVTNKRISNGRIW